MDSQITIKSFAYNHLSPQNTLFHCIPPQKDHSPISWMVLSWILGMVLKNSFSPDYLLPSAWAHTVVGQVVFSKLGRICLGRGWIFLGWRELLFHKMSGVEPLLFGTNLNFLKLLWVNISKSTSYFGEPWYRVCAVSLPTQTTHPFPAL